MKSKPPLPLTDDREQQALSGPLLSPSSSLAECLHVTVNSSLGMWLRPGVLFPGLGGEHVTTWPCSPASASSSGDADRTQGSWLQSRAYLEMGFGA